MKKHPIITLSVICLIIAIVTYVAPNSVPAFFRDYWFYFVIAGSLSVLSLLAKILGKIGGFICIGLTICFIICICNQCVPIPAVNNFLGAHQDFVYKFIAFPYAIMALLMSRHDD